ncbi:thymidine phosphorylase [Idiomarina seosinensis]|uniref:thymidine phosphorylase n=1 Tax=Idiomarina seosinensis TaxID=281739 RepID=UPI003850577C
MFIAQEAIRAKRDGNSLTDQQIQQFVSGITEQSVSEGQIAAMAMAIYFQGMEEREKATLTLAMRDSGEILNWQSMDLGGPVLDKHSTGGVGDVVSLMLGPIVAACGGYVPMISGRGLGHTGGTLDKFDAIPGYQTAPDNTLFRHTVKTAGVAIIGQTGQLAPADQRFYATRDITATVESIPLITASILAKKLAEGLDGLILDVKTGSGAFMAQYAQALELAQSLTSVANSVGVRTAALLTDMNEPLASAAGNAVEVQLAIDYLTGAHRGERLHQVTEALAAEMLLLGGLADSRQQALGLVNKALSSGQAAERFALMVSTLGGPDDLLEKPQQHLAQAKRVKPLTVKEAGLATSGFVTAIDTRAIGMAVVALGGGRRMATDALNYAVGLTDLIEVGSPLHADTCLVTIHADNESGWQQAAAMVSKAITISEEQPAAKDMIYQRITE